VLRVVIGRVRVVNRPISAAFDEQAALGIVYERLGVMRADEVWIEELRHTAFGDAGYRACSEMTSTYIDRALAVCLRTDGARWSGEIARDPCAVA